MEIRALVITLEKVVLPLNYGSPSPSWREDLTLKYTSHFGGTETDLAWIKLNILHEDCTITVTF
jgi:hypothetical protein